MIKFILNDKEISTDLPSGFLLLDFIRYQKHLTGTKIGCREGDCGACTVLVGELKDNQVEYKSVTSCLMALGNVHHKHVVTVEGLNMNQLNLVQQSMIDEGATQCGFCTPGFVVSLSGFCLSTHHSYEHAIASIDGNICRCTGYKSIERSVEKIVSVLSEKEAAQGSIEFLTERNFLPEYFHKIPQRLQILKEKNVPNHSTNGGKFLGGGTDLYVQQHDKMVNENPHLLFDNAALKGISTNDDICTIGAANTVTEIFNTEIFKKHFPKVAHHQQLISSSPIRNMATIAGNFVNASPIGDLTVFFLALDAQLSISDGKNVRQLPLREFYLGYKQLNKQPEEFITSISFKLPSTHSIFNFEKVSKRTHLDIASVNSAIKIEIENSIIIDASLSAGGVGPIPLYLKDASAFLIGKEITAETIAQLLPIIQNSITPMSDARGTKEYKTLLLLQLVKAHFLSHFPEINYESLIHS